MLSSSLFSILIVVSLVLPIFSYRKLASFFLVHISLANIVVVHVEYFKQSGHCFNSYPWGLRSYKLVEFGFLSAPV